MFGWKMMSPMLRVFDIRRVFVRVRSSVSSNWVLYLAVSVYIIVMSTITILKHQAFLTSGFDLGLINQAFSTTLFNHKLFYETADLSFNPGGSFFGTHFSPILFLLLPFYAIHPSAEILLVMQTVILALGAFPVYWMSRDKLGKKVGLIISIIYLVYPPLLLLNLNDFHLEAFTSTFFLFSVYYFEQEEWMKFSALIILAMLTLEFAPIIGVFMALYGLLLYSKKKFKDKRAAQKYVALTALLSILMFFLAFIAKESFNPYTSPLPSPFHYILSNPAGMPNVISSDLGAKMFYLINFLAPLAFLPLLAPEPLIMALPWIFASFGTTYAPYSSVYFQYTGFVIPFVFVALPKAIERAIERLKLQNARKILPILLLSTIIFALYLPVGQGSPWNYQLPTTNDRTELIQKILPLIPSNESVLTQNNIFPHLSNRMNAYMYLPRSSDITVNYILVDTTSPWYEWQQPALFGERTPLNVTTQEGLVNGNYGVLASVSSILLLKKGYIGEAALFVPFNSKCNYENLTLERGSIVEDPTSTSRLVLNHSEKDPTGTFWYGPYVDLLPGLYRVTYATKVNGIHEIIKNENKTLFTVDVSYDLGKKFLKTTTMVNGSRALSAGQWFNSTLFFNATTPTKGVEFRGFVEGNQSVSVCLDYLMVEQLIPQISKTAFNHEELYRDQGNVSNGVMTHVKGKGTFWYGPYTSLSKGNYTAKFWLKLDRTYNGTLLDVDVSINSGKKVLTFLTLSGSNFGRINAWQSFEVKFTLQNDLNIVEFRGVNVRELAPVSFLLVEVYPDTGG
jgi:uncharacterized membrane protein